MKNCMQKTKVTKKGDDKQTMRKESGKMAEMYVSFRPDVRK